MAFQEVYFYDPRHLSGSIIQMCCLERVKVVKWSKFQSSVVCFRLGPCVRNGQSHKGEAPEVEKEKHQFWLKEKKIIAFLTSPYICSLENVCLTMDFWLFEFSIQNSN